MSIQSRMSRDTVSITRFPSPGDETQDAEGGFNRASSVATAALRTSAGLVTSSDCRIMPLSDTERKAFGVKDSDKAWKFLYHTDPSITLNDVQTFTDKGGTSRTVETIEPSRDLDNQGRLFRVIGTQVEGET